MLLLLLLYLYNNLWNKGKKNYITLHNMKTFSISIKDLNSELYIFIYLFNLFIIFFYFVVFNK